MSIFRQPYERHDYRGGLDSGLVFYLLKKYGKSDEWWLEQFEGGDIVPWTCELLDITLDVVRFSEGEDARSVPAENNLYDGVISHPPYWRAIKYSESPRDLSNCSTYEEFIKELGKTLTEAERVLKPGGWFVIITGDVRREKKLYPIHSDVIQYMKGFPNMTLRDIVIWELTATGTAMLATEWMLMGNYCMIWEKMGHDLSKEFE